MSAWRLRRATQARNARQAAALRPAAPRPTHHWQRGVLHLCEVREAQHLGQGALAGGRQWQAGKRGGGQVAGGACRRSGHCRLVVRVPVVPVAMALVRLMHRRVLHLLVVPWQLAWR